MIAVADIRAARERIAGRIHHTPLLTSQTLGQRVGARAWLKAENLQKTGAFKVRGALNAILQLSEEERARGIITVSAGNHAQGVAWAAAAVGVPATVVMAENATPSKVAATRGYGAEVVQHGTSSLDLFGKMEELRAARGLTLVHPFDADAIIAGQGTLGLEVLDDLPEFGAEGDTIVVPVGGGGLIGGIAVAIKESRPAARVIGVEPVGAPGMSNSLAAGHAVHLDHIDTIADGLTAPFAGERNFDIVRRYVEDIVLLDDETILEGMRFLLARAKLLAEPAGAAATAALLAGKVTVAPGARVVAVVSGGNIDLPRLKALL